MRFPFNFEKTVQIAAYFLRKAGNRINYMVLLKLIYIADREYLLTMGETITGDDVYAMKNGPVLSRIDNFIIGDPRGKLNENEKCKWNQYFKTDSNPHAYCIDLISEPGDDLISASLRTLLDSVFDRFGNYSEWAISDYTHTFPEWQMHAEALSKNNRRKSIDWKEVIKDNPARLADAKRNLELIGAMSSLAEYEV